MSSSSESPVRTRGWAPALDLTPAGLSQFDPARVRQAIDEGYQAGLEAGRAEALATGQETLGQELERLRAQATGLVAGLGAATDVVRRHEAGLAEAFATTIASGAVQLAVAILGRELADETVAATSAVERSLAAIGRRPGTVVQLHPDDCALIDESSLPEGICIEPNPALQRGDAIAQTDDRTVDARIATALDRAQRVLAGEEHP